jgi:hypothetical protein
MIFENRPEKQNLLCVGHGDKAIFGDKGACVQRKMKRWAKQKAAVKRPFRSFFGAG